MTTIETLFTPADFRALAWQELGRTTCVVFDVLRATSTIVTALANGAAAVIPVAEIAEAVAWRRKQPDVLLAGEREGVRIRAEQSGGVDFDLGNSPPEFTAEKVADRTIVTTTTNGTLALRACAGAERVLVGSFLNLRATAEALMRRQPERVLLVCSGTGERAALEDALCAGALCELLSRRLAASQLLDSACISLENYARHKADLSAAMSMASNGRALLARPELREDVAFCLRRDVLDVVAELGKDGAVRRLNRV